MQMGAMCSDGVEDRAAEDRAAEESLIYIEPENHKIITSVSEAVRFVRAAPLSQHQEPRSMSPAPAAERQLPSAMCGAESMAGASVHLGSVGAQQLGGEVQGQQRCGGEEEVQQPRRRHQIMTLVRVPCDEPRDGVERRTPAPLRARQTIRPNLEPA
jgi:hypothetical protein